MMARRIRTSREDVPYLPKQHIEDEAAVLLAEYGREHGEVTEPPVPIDDIIEIHLRLTLEFKDMRQLFRFGDVHGALWVNRGVVGVDLGLDPNENPSKLGRYRFTLAHEAGHWRLHRQHFLDNAAQRSLFESDTKPAYICRTSEATSKPVEWQANFFAACLLMPRHMVYATWKARRGNLDAVTLHQLREHETEIVAAETLRRGGMSMSRESIDNALLEAFSRPLADQFNVSAEAMRIRLEEIGLLKRKKEHLLF